MLHQTTIQIVFCFIIFNANHILPQHILTSFTTHILPQHTSHSLNLVPKAGSCTNLSTNRGRLILLGFMDGDGCLYDGEEDQRHHHTNDDPVLIGLQEPGGMMRQNDWVLWGSG